MEAPDEERTAPTADEHKEEERKEGDPPGDIAAARGDEVLCVCCNYGTVARCVDCVCGFEQLNYNEENLIYKNEDLALLKQSHCNASVVLESANGKRDTDDCGIDAPVYKRGCRSGYYEPRGAARGPNPHLDTAAPCPDGFFCLADAALEDGGTCKYWKHVEKGAESHAVTYYNATLQRYVHGDVCPGASHVALCAAGYSCPSPAGRDKGRRTASASSASRATSAPRAPSTACAAAGTSSARGPAACANKFYAMAAIAGIVFILAFGTSSVWVSLMAYLHLRRARGATSRRATRPSRRSASSDGDRGVAASRAAPDDGDDYASRTRRACFAAVGACGFVVRHAKRQAYSIFRRDAERRHCCGVSPANHLRVALAAGLSLVALVLVTLGRLSSFHALVGAYAGVAALLVASSCALCTFQRAAGARTCLLCSKEGHAAMALLGCAVGLGGALVVLRRGVLDYDDDGVDDDAAPRHLEVLKGVTGRCASGRVTAIMGPSGAGKTTMLNVLSGRASYGVTTGEDTMHTNLTVGENVEFYGALRLPRHYTAWDVRKVVERTLEVLGLEHIEGSVIGDAEKRGISGGQRKRVNVAMEIPSFFIFRMFHDVLLLCRGGRTAYCGPSEGALPYFEASGFSMPAFENPADFFMDVIAGKAAVRDGASPFAGALADVAGVQDSRKGARQHAAALAELWERHAGESRDTLEDAPHPTTPGRLEPAGRLSRFKDAQTLFFMLNLGVGLTASSRRSAFAVSGFAYALSIAQDPMASQLSMVMLVLVFVLFCGISPKLSQIDNMGPAAQRAPARAVSRSRSLAPGPRRRAALSYGRWPWAWYAKPNQDCALAGLFSLSFSELYRAKSGHLRTINDLNIPILFAIGAAMRVVSNLLLLLCNRDKMGKQTILQPRAFLNPSPTC
ncbi:ATPase [Aureococcus anophagefferens]|nr:ATPase [Aureococcus anophagefferens]